MSDNPYLDRQVEERLRTWEAAKALLDAAAAEKRDLSGEEQESFDRMNADIDARDQRITDLRNAEARARKIDAAADAAPEVRDNPIPVRSDATPSDEEMLQKLFRGEIRSHTFRKRSASELRLLNKTDDGGATVPTDFYSIIQENMLYTGPMLDAGYFTRIDTGNGQNITIPTEATRPSGSATAEGTDNAYSEGTYGSAILRAWKYSTVTPITLELDRDAGFDITAFLGRQLGVALGTAVNSALTLGTGTVQPQGISGAAGSGITGGTGVAGVPTFDDLIGLVHAVDTAYVSRPSTAFLMRRATLGSVRKLKDTAGNYLWSPASSVGTPDRVLGYPVLENPYVAATATDAKSVLFGDLSSFFVRTVGGIEVERSDQVLWLQDGIAFKARVWVDGALGQSGAVKYFKGGTA